MIISKCHDGQLEIGLSLTKCSMQQYAEEIVELEARAYNL